MFWDWTRDPLDRFAKKFALLFFSTIKVHSKRGTNISPEFIFNDFSIFLMIDDTWIFIERIHNFNLPKKEKRKELIEIQLKLKPSRYQFPIDSN